MKPNLFIVGAPKCGTTAWVEYLGAHPDIFFSPRKEPNFFDTDFPRQPDVHTIEQYLALFASAGNAKVVGEASVRYLYSEEAARNIRQFNPDAKIVILVRDQEDYLPSRHNQLLFNGIEDIEDFEKAWRLSGKRDAASLSRGCLVPRSLDYRAAGAFSAQVERYYAQFPEEQIRVFHFRSWVGSPRATYLELMDFLGLEDDGRDEFPQVNEARHHASPALLRLARTPPAMLRAPVELLKKAIRAESLGLADLAVRLGTRSGSRSSISDALKEEIKAYFKHDNAQLEPRIWRPSEDRRPHQG